MARGDIHEPPRSTFQKKLKKTSTISCRHIRDMYNTGMEHTNTLITIKQIAALFPGRDGQGVHPKTVWRWILLGCNGRKLKAVKAGHRWCSTWGWVNEFVNASTVETCSVKTAGLSTARDELSRRWGIESGSREESSRRRGEADLRMQNR